MTAHVLFETTTEMLRQLAEWKMEWICVLCSLNYTVINHNDISMFVSLQSPCVHQPQVYNHLHLNPNKPKTDHQETEDSVGASTFLLRKPFSGWHHTGHNYQHLETKLIFQSNGSNNMRSDHSNINNNKTETTDVWQQTATETATGTEHWEQ